VLPTQAPLAPGVVHPGHSLEPQLAHSEQLTIGVPVHPGVTWKVFGGSGTLKLAALQQICPVQSLLVSQVCGQVAAQSPSQQIAVVPEHSDEVVHAVGQGWYAGFKQRPGALRVGSSFPTDAQQTSPAPVLQVLLDVQLLGHSSAGKQIGVL
jgi:hypothetical protein